MSGFFEQLLQRITSLQNTLVELGWIGVVGYAVFIAIFQVTMLPLSPVAVAGGFIFGLGRGFVAVSLGTALGASINFLIARHLARKPLEKRLRSNEKFRLIDQAIGREGWRIVALLRFCPIPFGFSNYCYGLTAIPFLPYIAATVPVIIPGNFLFSYLGATAQEGLNVITGAGRARHPGEYMLMGVGLLASFIAVAYVAKVARAAVAQREPELA